MGESHKGNRNGHVINGTCEIYEMIASILEYAYVYIHIHVYISRSSFPLHNDCTSVCCSVLQCVAVYCSVLQCPGHRRVGRSVH